MESTFESMRQGYKPVYDELKHKFIEEQIGIFDKTTNIEDTIALSDVWGGWKATISIK